MVRTQCGQMDSSLVTLADFICSMLDRKSTRLNSSHLVISYAGFFLEKRIAPPNCGTLSFICVHLRPAMFLLRPNGNSKPDIGCSKFFLTLTRAYRSPLLPPAARSRA